MTESNISQRLKKIAKAIDNNALALHGGCKNWFCYHLNITELVWARNLMDGFQICIQFQDRHLGNITVDNNLNKMIIAYNFQGEDKTIEI